MSVERKRYYVVYNRSGQQVGHISTDDIAAERARHPDLDYQPSKLAERATT